MRRARLGCTSNVSLNSQRVCRVAFHGASGVGGAWVKLCPFGNRVAVPGLCMYARSLPDGVSDGKSSTNDVGSRHMDMDGGDEEENDGFSLADFKLSPENKVILACAFSFVIAQMDKINISIAVIEMAKDFGWSPTVIGLVQSSFFYGYLLSQLPGGYASTKFGGRNVLYFAVISFSLSTMCIPFAASTIPGLFLSRAAVGFGEGLLPAAVTDLIARTVQPSQRSGATSFVFGALQVGSLVGLTLAPTLIDVWGWPSVFYMFGGGGLLFFIWWNQVLTEIEKTTPGIFAPVVDTSVVPENLEDDQVPWRAFARAKPVQALCFVHFVHNWFHYTMLAWLPTYLTDSMSLPLSTAAKIALLPPIAASIVSGVAGPSADALIARGIPVGIVRKCAQTIAFLGPALCLSGASLVDDDPISSIALITLSLGISSFSLAGLYCNHADLSPKYAPVLIGATNTVGAIPGIVGVVLVGKIYDSTDSWALSLFAPAITLFVLGTVVFWVSGTATRQNFERKSRNVKFGWEEYWPNMKKLQ
mmetsp:Transcript_4901/g.9777  ORF Transcript_4901/g.9777 Transcript_4901/m.9777 type:complete len:531 (-) Transcript_4901:1549-3141(-)